MNIKNYHTAHSFRQGPRYQGAKATSLVTKLAATLMLSILGTGYALADSTSVSVSKVNAQGTSEELGQIRIEETEHGLLFTPDLQSLPGGMHGFHVHEHGSCDPAHKEGEMSAAEAAGGHFDPDGKGKHLGPYADGHLGDLPALYVDEQGNATTPVLAPRLTSVEQLKGRAVMIHAGGDNYSDDPKPLGGGGARLACGVI